MLQGYSGIVSDLDGVVYRGAHAIPGAVPAYRKARAAGVRIAYATNNAARPPGLVAGHLRELGLDVADADVVTSAMAGAERVASLVPAGSPVLAVGGPGVADCLTRFGLEPVTVAASHDAPGEVAAVLQGFGHNVTWHDLAEAAYAVQAGAVWVATNLDRTRPMPRGQCPGNGPLVDAVRACVDHDPIVVGKPHPDLYRLCATILGTTPATTLAIGDRLDTDIVGAVHAGMDALCVMTGVTSLRDLALAPTEHRPRYLADDLGALHRPYRRARSTLDGGLGRARCGEATVTVGSGGVQAEGGGTTDERRRACVAAAWAAADGGLDLSEPAGDLPLWRRLEDWIAGGEAA